MEAYNMQESLDEFSAARESFDTMVTVLRSAEMMNAEHADVEKYLLEDGVELLKLIQQGYMGRRSEAEKPRESVLGADGSSADASAGWKTSALRRIPRKRFSDLDGRQSREPVVIS